MQAPLVTRKANKTDQFYDFIICSPHRASWPTCLPIKSEKYLKLIKNFAAVFLMFDFLLLLLLLLSVRSSKRSKHKSNRNCKLKFIFLRFISDNLFLRKRAEERVRERVKKNVHKHVTTITKLVFF